jgi:hypothetical protein
MIGFSCFSEFAINEFPASVDFSEPSVFGELLKSPDAQLIYLIEMTPYDADRVITVSGDAPLGTNAFGEYDFHYTGGETTVYISDVGFVTEPDDHPANTTYLPLTSNPLLFDISILQGEDFRGGLPSVGAIRLENGDKGLEDLTGYYWSGRTVRVFAGAKGFTRAQFVKVFEGVAREPEFDEQEIIINIADKAEILETEFFQRLYEGDGGLEGGADIKGAPKPLAYGECLNVSPVLVDAANLIYQIHDGSMEAVTACYDKGVALTSGGDVADITAASVSAGQFKTQLSGGYIKLGSTPTGRITANIKGDNSGGYVDNVGAIIRRITQTKLGSKSFSSAEIDEGAFNRLDDVITGTAGVYVFDRTTARSLFDALINPVHAWWTFTRQGKLTCGVVDAPGTPVYEFTENQITEIEVLRVIPPAWRITLGHSRSWTRQTSDDLAAAATDEYKTFVQEEFRKEISEDRNIRTKTASAVERSFDTLLVGAGELERLERIYRSPRKVYRIALANMLFRVFVGDTIRLKLGRFGLDAGKNFIITAISEDAETALTILEVWG